MGFGSTRRGSWNILDHVHISGRRIAVGGRRGCLEGGQLVIWEEQVKIHSAVEAEFYWETGLEYFAQD